MTSTELRETLRQIHQAVEAPPVDEVAFRARVRAERRRHLGGRALLAGAAATVLATGGAVVTHLVDRPTGAEAPVAEGGPAATGTVPDTVWFVRDGRLTSLDRSGQVHQPGLRSEGVIGWTSERVYALDAESHVVVLGRESDHEGQGRDLAYPREQSPVRGPVQSVALSADGRYLAWMDLQDTVTVFDVKADAVQYRVNGPRNGYVAAVSAEGVLVSEDVDLVLHTPSGGETRVPTQEAGDNWGAQLAMGRVLVAGPSGTSLYDVRSGDAERVAVLPGGQPALAPYALAAASLEPAPGDAATLVHLWDGEQVRDLRGIDGRPQEVRFADESTLLVSTGPTGSAGLWACSVADLGCEALPVPGEVSLSE